MTNDISEKEVEVSDFARFMTAPKVEKGVSALLQVLTDFQKNVQKSQLFKDDAQVIYLQIAQFKIPLTPKAELRVTLPHPLSVDKDVCLIVKNVKTGKKKDNERTINHYNNLVRESGITRAITIIPIGQLCDEHKQYEEKGKFAQLYDSYLVDGRFWSVAARSLGIRFSKAGKHLIPLNMKAKGFKKHLEAALSKTVMIIHPKGDTFTMKVGYSSMTLTELSDNVLAAMTGLCRNGMLPGGFDNIRAVHVKAARSMAIPIYLSRKKHNDVARPVRKVKIPKDYKVVEGELSTMIGGIVRVNPEGDVQVRRELTAEDRMMMAEDDGEEIVKSTKEEVSSDPGSEDEEPEAKPLKRKLSADEESNDEEVEAAEENYIKEREGGLDGKDSDEEEEELSKKDGEAKKTSPKSMKLRKRN